MDFDPRDHDSRDEERCAPDGSRAGNSDRDEYHRDADPRQPAVASRDRDDGDPREPGRGPGDSRESQSDERSRDACDDARWLERERDERTRDTEANGHDTTRAKTGARVDREKLRQIDLHWHDLRHEGAGRLLADGVDIRTIQLMLGHSDIKQTQRYLNITDEELRKAMTGVWERRRQLRLSTSSSRPERLVDGRAVGQ
jgi:hypothetical protein